MKRQFQILKSILISNWFWILLWIILTILAFVFLLLRPSMIPIQEIDFISLIAYPIKNQTFFGELLTIYQIGLLIFILYQYYERELEYSKENIILRYSSKKWIKEKTITSFFLILLGKIIQILVIYIYFTKDIPFKIEYLLSPMIYDLLISTLLLTRLNYHHNLLFNLILIVLGVIMFFNYNIMIILLFIIFAFGAYF